MLPVLRVCAWEHWALTLRDEFRLEVKKEEEVGKKNIIKLPFYFNLFMVLTRAETPITASPISLIK
jgi:hypothetical protein